MSLALLKSNVLLKYSLLEQADTDGDGVGDLCDNCVMIKNRFQENVDGDQFGDRCDRDIDNDGFNNKEDNCPYVANVDQKDQDGDGVGDLCDNCEDVFNPDQDDYNHNLVGDACDDGADVDLDGVPDGSDNCPLVDNADQIDTDDDGLGDDCDDDADNDGIENEIDNCPLIPNPDQLDGDKDGVGDLCFRNFDGDNSLDEFDACPSNAQIDRTDFRAIQPIAMGENSWGQPQPLWQFKNEGKEIQQLLNSAPGIAIGNAKLAGVDFEGTFYVGPHSPLDNDFIGIIFSFQVREKRRVTFSNHIQTTTTFSIEAVFNIINNYNLEVSYLKYILLHSYLSPSLSASPNHF